MKEELCFKFDLIKYVTVKESMFLSVDKYAFLSISKSIVVNCRGPPPINLKKIQVDRRFYILKREKSDIYEIFSDEKNKQHIITFKDGMETLIQIPINKEVKEVFIEFKKIEKSQQNEYDRHIEHSEIYENKLHSRVMDKPISIEEEIENKFLSKKLREAISSLSEIQKRRIKMYYFKKMTQKEIADKEGTSIRAVQYTLNHALEELRKIFEKN